MICQTIQNNRRKYLAARSDEIYNEIIKYLEYYQSNVTTKKDWFEAYQIFKNNILIPTDSLAYEIFNIVCEDTRTLNDLYHCLME